MNRSIPHNNVCKTRPSLLYFLKNQTSSFLDGAGCALFTEMWQKIALINQHKTIVKSKAHYYIFCRQFGLHSVVYTASSI